MAGSNNVGYCTNKIITSSAVSENVVHCMNTFITSRLAFGCLVGCHRRILVVGLLFLSTSVVRVLRQQYLSLQPNRTGDQSLVGYYLPMVSDIYTVFLRRKALLPETRFPHPCIPGTGQHWANATIFRMTPFSELVSF